jgi:hypothetical protein
LRDQCRRNGARGHACRRIGPGRRTLSLPAGGISDPEGGGMSDALIDLIFWIAIFAVFFFGFRWLQRRNRKDD